MVRLETEKPHRTFLNLVYYPNPTIQFINQFKFDLNILDNTNLIPTFGIDSSLQYPEGSLS